MYDIVGGDIFEIGIKDNKPNKDASLVFIPIIRVRRAVVWVQVSA